MTSGSFYSNLRVTASREKQIETETDKERQRKREGGAEFPREPLPSEGFHFMVAERYPHKMDKTIPCVVPEQSHRDKGYIPNPQTSS